MGADWRRNSARGAFVAEVADLGLPPASLTAMAETGPSAVSDRGYKWPALGNFPQCTNPLSTSKPTARRSSR